MSAPKTIFVIGGTGAQGIPVIRGLVEDGAYHVRVLTRDTTSARAQQLVALNPSRVELVQGSFTSEEDLRAGFKGVWGAFVNIDGFATGEKAELFWAIRTFEIAVQNGVEMFVYGNLDYASKQSGYNEAVRAGHYDGKGRIGEWILWQNKDNKGKSWYKTKAALFTTGPYAEMVIAAGTPMSPTVEDVNGEEVVTWRVPLTDKGAPPHVSLDDCAYYVRWLFDDPARADGMDLAVAIEHAGYAAMAAAFARVTGRPARFVDAPMAEYWATGVMSPLKAFPAGYTAAPADPATMSVEANFTGFWEMFRRAGGEGELLRRDYKLLDEIYPGRIRSMEEFFRREDEKAKAQGSSLWERVKTPRPVLKVAEDGNHLKAKKKREANM
jgi:hypothetical protein